MKRLLTATVLGLLVALALVYRDRLDIVALRAFVEGQGALLAPLLFVAIYAAATVLFLPGSLLTLAGGLLFGPLWGTLYSLGGATLGASLAFLLARYLASDWVERRASGLLLRLKQGVEAEGWRFVALVRLVPLFPFNLLNYALGLTRIPLRSYVLTSALCMLPGALAYSWLGHLGAAAAGGAEGLAQQLTLGLALFALVLFLPRWVLRWRGSVSRLQG